MPQSLSQIHLHIIFSTQDRKGLLFQELQEELYSYLTSACNAHGSYAAKIGGTKSHVHVATTLPRTISVSKLLEEIKKSSSKWLKTKDTRLNTFSWQKGYRAFSVGQSQLSNLIDYIKRQENHHQCKSFKEEYLEFLKRYKIEYDELYIWD